MNLEFSMSVAQRNYSLERPLSLNNSNIKKKQNNQQERGSLIVAHYWKSLLLIVLEKEVPVKDLIPGRSRLLLCL